MFRVQQWEEEEEEEEWNMKNMYIYYVINILIIYAWMHKKWSF